MIDQWIKNFVEVGENSLAVRDWESYGSVFAEDFKMVTSMFPEPVFGRDTRIQFVQGIYDSFPDGVVKVQHSFGSGNWGCVRVLFTGTHTGPMPGPDGNIIPPTGKSVEWPYVMIMKFEDGLVVELYEYYDQVGLLHQLGLM
jgi:predicted ester cyclase